MKLFGFEIKRTKDESTPSFISSNEDDGSLNIAVTGTSIGTYLDLEGHARSEAELVQSYRNIIREPEIAQAVDDIINECINITPDKSPVECITDDIDVSNEVKKKIREEFDYLLSLLDFQTNGYDILQNWYVDGRLYYHAVIDQTNPKHGIKKLQYIDPRKIRKIREQEDQKISDEQYNIYVKKEKKEYYIYNPRGFVSNNKFNEQTYATTGLKIAKDSIIYSNSGIMNEDNSLVLSYLHKAIKPLNQLRMLEDAVVIYRIARAPERRVFYIDVGDLPKARAEQHLRDMMVKHKNKLVYDSKTGDIRDDRRHMSMTDDYWLPRREGGKNTEITTLPGGQNLGEMEDVEYFQKRLYRSLNIPISRFEPDANFTLGRSSEISRDEIKFSKFIRRLRSKFTSFFNSALEKQLILKNIINANEWENIKKHIRYDFMKDNHFEELKESEILQNRIGLVREIEEYRGVYYSKKWVKENILKMTEHEIEIIDKEIEKEKEEEPDENEESDLNINN